jgi:hypothetical protein
MPGYEVNAHSAARAHVVFTLLATGVTWPTWSPIDTAEILNDEGDAEGAEGVGTTRVFRTGRNVSREKVEELVPDRRLGYVMVGGPLRDYRGDVSLSPAADGGTDICWRATFSPKIPGTGWFWQLFLSRYMRRFVDGLAAHAASLDRAA